MWMTRNHHVLLTDPESGPDDSDATPMELIENDPIIFSSSTEFNNVLEGTLAQSSYHL